LYFEAVGPQPRFSEAFYVIPLSKNFFFCIYTNTSFLTHSLQNKSLVMLWSKIEFFPERSQRGRVGIGLACNLRGTGSISKDVSAILKFNPAPVFLRKILISISSKNSAYQAWF
jgi:hypothetical protein